MSRYEIRDNDHPDWRGQRFANLERAERELARCEGASGRWTLVDRQERKDLATR